MNVRENEKIERKTYYCKNEKIDLYYKLDYNLYNANHNILYLRLKYRRINITKIACYNKLAELAIS